MIDRERGDCAATPAAAELQFVFFNQTAKFEEMEKQVSIDPDLNAYGSFFTDSFARDAFVASDDVPALGQIAFDLVLSWRSASYACALPAQLPLGIKRFHDAFADNADTYSGVLRFADVIVAKVSRNLPELAGDTTLVTRLREELVKNAADIRDLSANARTELDADQVWNNFLSLHPFQMGLHSTLLLGYVGVYTAYENFLVRALSIAEGGSRVRIVHSDFKQRFRKCFGGISDRALVSPEVNRFKLVRNAIVHAGARLTEELEKQKPLPVVEHEGALHVHPRHLKHLYDTLKAPALEVLRAACFRVSEARV